MIFLTKRNFALVGRSGTGKSFRAQYLAAKYHIQLIVDDGLLISGDKIIAGKSAKQEQNFITAVKCALFKDPDHLEQVLLALAKTKYKRILVIGTSEKMVNQIAEILRIGPIDKIIHIEDIADKESIETAMRIRYSEGKHVIPVNPLQITRSYPGLAYDSIKLGKIRRLLFFINRKSVQNQEKTVVKPEFSKENKTTISSAAIKQMVNHCLYEYESTMKIEDVSFILDNQGYTIDLQLRTPVHMTIEEHRDLTLYIRDSLERYGGILINKINLIINEWK